MRWARPLTAILALLLAACSQKDPTEIVVEIRTDIPVPAQMNALRLVVSSGAQLVFDQRFTLGEPPGVMLPRRVTLVPEGGSTPTVTVEVSGLDGDRVVVSRRAVLPFLAERSLLLIIDLSRACVSQGCEQGSTCIQGLCTSDRVDPTRLPRPTPAPGPAVDANPAPIPDAAVTPTADGGDATSPVDLATEAPRPDAPTPAPDVASMPDVAPMPDLPVTTPDAAPDLPPPPDSMTRKLDGERCTGREECQSSVCADGVCCGSACDGLCRSCNLAGRAGICTTFAAATDPDNECGDDGSASCQRDGFCDGAGACRLYGSGTQCLPGSCAGATRTFPSTCDGAGRCLSGGSQSCAPYLCGSGGVCADRCGSNGDCLPPNTCVGGACVGPSENCTNGVDDDLDLRADCADPDCQPGFACVPDRPAGWIGPVAFGQNKAASECTGAYPTLSYTGKSGLTCAPASCSACTCGTPETVTCAPPHLAWQTGSFCGGLTITEPSGESCTIATNNTGSEPTHARIYPSFASGGRCPAAGGVPSLPPQAWAGSGLACESGPLRQGGCAGAQLCAPRAPGGFEAALCIYASGDRPCPAPYTNMRRVFYENNAADDRRCTPCGCDRPENVSCGGRVTFFGDKTCDTAGPTASVPSPMSPPLCVEISKYYVATIYSPSISGGSCKPGGGAPAGGCMPLGATTVCCL